MKGGSAVRAWVAMTGCTELQYLKRERKKWEALGVQARSRDACVHACMCAYIEAT